jgi:hypothetical protein
MPRDYRRWFHDRHNIQPTRPQSPQHDPKDPIEATQHRSSTFPLQHSNLLTQREHLQRDTRRLRKRIPQAARIAQTISITNQLLRCNDSVSFIWFARQALISHICSVLSTYSPEAHELVAFGTLLAKHNQSERAEEILRQAVAWIPVYRGRTTALACYSSPLAAWTNLDPR